MDLRIEESSMEFMNSEDDAVKAIGITDVEDERFSTHQSIVEAQQKLKAPQMYLDGIPETRATFTPEEYSIRKEQQFLNNATNADNASCMRGKNKCTIF